MHKESSVSCQCLVDANTVKVKFQCQVLVEYVLLSENGRYWRPFEVRYYKVIYFLNDMNRFQSGALP